MKIIVTSVRAWEKMLYNCVLGSTVNLNPG